MRTPQEDISFKSVLTEKLSESLLALKKHFRVYTTINGKVTVTKAASVAKDSVSTFIRCSFLKTKSPKPFSSTAFSNIQQVLNIVFKNFHRCHSSFLPAKLTCSFNPQF